MAYSEEYLGGCVIPSSTAPLSAQVLTSTGDKASFYLGEAIELSRLEFLVSAAVVAGLTAPVISVYARPTFGSTSGQILIGTLTIPTGTAAGQILYKNVESVKLEPGYTLVFNVSTAATDSGSAAGSGFSMFKAFMITEDPKNVSLMVLSV